VAFVIFDPDDFAGAKARVRSYRELAQREYGRDIQLWTAAYVVQGNTEKEARDFFDYYVHQKGDWVAVTNLVETMGIAAKTLPPETLRSMKAHFIAGWGGYPLVGTNEQIVDGLGRLSEMGLDGAVLSWPRYIDGMRQFKQEIMPLAKQAGLR
jgi:FMNH2-dependent dimethyl sulfone monooxygenase